MALARKSRLPYSWTLALMQRRTIITLIMATYVGGFITGGISTGLMDHDTFAALRSYLLDPSLKLVKSVPDILTGAGFCLMRC